MYVSLISWYVLQTRKINFIFLLSILFLAIGDLLVLIQGEVFRYILAFSFVGNLGILYYMMQKLKSINIKTSVLKKLTLVIGLIICLFIFTAFFASFKIYLLNFSLLLVVLFYVSYLFYIKSVSQSSFLILAGVVLLMITYAFTGVNEFVVPYKYFSLIDAASYALALYLICTAVLSEDNKYEETINIE